MSTSTILIGMLGAASACIFFYLLRFKASAKQTNRNDRIDWYGSESKRLDPEATAEQSADIEKPPVETHEPTNQAIDRAPPPQAIPSSSPIQATSPRINKWLVAAAVILVVVVLLSFYESTNA
ncbi:MAG: hypothetical protein VYC36_00980 [Pseudomonadota bacterium]|nr:hypothetical protein [Pseudomonadota bacterium]